MKQLIQGNRQLTAGWLDGSYADPLIEGDMISVVLPIESITTVAKRIDVMNHAKC